MINFLSNWIEQITLSVIIVSIFELILPKGNLKKYIKVVLGVYIIYCFISPFVNNNSLYNIGDINLDDYVQIKETNNLQSVDARIENLYIDELKKSISKKVQEKGYKVSKCDIDAKLTENSENSGINNISLILKNNNIEKIEIGAKNENNQTAEEIKEELAKDYEIDKNLINIKIK